MLVGTDEDWETITGLIDDIDAWIANPRFGSPLRDEYSQAIDAGASPPVHFLVDFASSDGEIVGSQGYSVGGGWIPSDDGNEISHPTRGKIVKSAVYGQLIDAVVIDLQVPMKKHGTPLVAKSWEGLGFHWKQAPHKTLKEGETRTSPMPTEFLGKMDMSAAAEPKAGAPKAAKAAKATPGDSTVASKLTVLAKNMELPAFQAAALKIAEVASSDDLLSQVLDDSETGFWATHHAG